MSATSIFGYASKISVRPGDTFDVFVSATGATHAEAQLVRLIHGDAHPDGPGYQETEIASPLDGTWAVGRQRTQVGSYLTVEDPEHRLDDLHSFTAFTFVMPTLPDSGTRQTIFGRWDTVAGQGYSLDVDETGYFEIRYGAAGKTQSVRAAQPIIAKTWYFVAAVFDADAGTVTLHTRSVVTRYNSLLSPNAMPSMDAATVSAPLAAAETPMAAARWLMACADVPTSGKSPWTAQHFHGKLDQPAILGHAASPDELEALSQGADPEPLSTVAHWDTTVGYTDAGIGHRVVDVGPHQMHAAGHNHPVRGQTGWNWSGRHDSFHTGAHEYGGIEFHADAVVDCKWEVTRTVAVPADLASGVYAIRLRIADGQAMNEEYVVFFVRAATPTAKLCFLVPVQSYLAYANEHLSLDAPGIQPMMGQPPVVADVDLAMHHDPEFGYATYDTYADGSGVSYSSYLRPLFSMRPKYRMSSNGVPWQFPADLSIIAWLEHSGHDWELITDEDVHREGVEALRPYRCVMSGTHPEYCSEQVLDGIEDFLGEGGRFMYMGGNGFYWSVALDPANPAVMEVRKLDAGHRSWNARPGEHYMATTGRKAGLWKQLNRHPQKIFGVGSISEGWETGQGYTKMPDAGDPAMAWIFDGVPEDVIGDFGLAHGGSAGLEIDRYDLTHGTPPHTRVVASSSGHSDNYVVFQDEIFYMQPGLTGSYDYRIRADMAYYDTTAGGAMFSTGSIAFGQALPYNDFDNNAARVVDNVVTAFLAEGLPTTFLSGSA